MLCQKLRQEIATTGDLLGLQVETKGARKPLSYQSVIN